MNIDYRKFTRLFLKCFDLLVPEGLISNNLTKQFKKKKKNLSFLSVILKPIFILQIKIKSDCFYLGKSKE